MSEFEIDREVFAGVEVIVGFDFGIKSTGYAVGEVFSQTARPVGALVMFNGEPTWSEVLKVISDLDADAVIVGLPLTMKGNEQDITKRARAFMRKLQAQLAAAGQDLPVWAADERQTTLAACDELYATQGRGGLVKAKIDAQAAAIMLTAWLKDNGS